MPNANRPDSWLHLAARPSIVKRAYAYAVIVGAILIAINQGDVILQGHITSACLLKMGLTVTVPYAVSTLSSIAALRTPKSDHD